MRWMICVTAAAVVSAFCLPAGGIVLNQLDDFEDGTTMSWLGGASPTNIANDGPTGAGDNFLQIGYTEFPGNLATTNAFQWTGDYLAAGVTAVKTDLIHLAGDGPVTLRVMIINAGNVWASTNTTVVTGDWNSYTFPLDAAHMVQVQGAASLADTLANVTNFVIRHDSAVPTPPGGGPPQIAAMVGLDNIRAIPEPTSVMLLGIAGVALLRRRTA